MLYRIFKMQPSFVYTTCMILCAVAYATDITVVTNVGNITGFEANAIFNNSARKVAKFLGIPYAEAPTGNLRFRKPVLKSKFTKTYDAKEPGPACPQNPFYLQYNLTFSEDCLTLNVFVPSSNGGINVTTKRAVMVFIHGGGFIYGSPDLFEGDKLSTFNDVIVVTIHYRLSVFGFLSTGDSASLGNYGLWDQQLAIKWIHDNIASFGGDNARITIFGESAGAASVIYQSLYPPNKEMFQRMIGESGSVLAEWSFREFGDYQKFVLREFSNRLGCFQTQSGMLVQCLRRQNINDLMEALNFNESEINRGFHGKFIPTVDGEFLKASPNQIFHTTTYNARVSLDFFRSLDLIIGVNDKEGGFSVPIFDKVLKHSTGKTLADGCPKNFFLNIVVPGIVQTIYNKPIPLIEAAITFKYTDWSEPDDVFVIRDNFMKLNSDFLFFAPAIKTAIEHSKLNANSSTFFYEFAHRPSWDNFTPSWVSGASHTLELVSVFGDAYSRIQEEIDLSADVMAAWTNFAKTGNPNTPVGLTANQWPEYNMERQKYFIFSTNKSLSHIQERFVADRAEFWNSLIPALMNVTESN